jgi:hypothetical protein
MRAVLAPYVTADAGSHLHVQIDDGEADVYLECDGTMANHISGQNTWDVLLKERRPRTG